jgi:hypothetical protein
MKDIVGRRVLLTAVHSDQIAFSVLKHPEEYRKMLKMRYMQFPSLADISEYESEEEEERKYQLKRREEWEEEVEEEESVEEGKKKKQATVSEEDDEYWETKIQNFFDRDYHDEKAVYFYIKKVKVKDLVVQDTPAKKQKDAEKKGTYW